MALIVDDDVGFTFWLGEMLTESGYQSFPALTCTQALNFIRQWSLAIDVLVLNPQLRGAVRFVKILARMFPGLRVVFILDPAERAAIAGDQEAVVERPEPYEPISRAVWIAKIRKVLMRASAAR